MTLGKEFFRNIIKFVRLSLFSILLLVSSTAFSNAELQVVLGEYEGGETVDHSNYPRYKVKLRATDDGSPVTLTKDNVLLIESNLYSKPNSAELVGGYLEVEWITRVKGPQAGTGIPSVVEVIATVDGESGSAEGYYFRQDMAQLRFRNIEGFQKKEFTFGTVAPGKDSLQKIFADAVQGLKDSFGEERPVKLDSVTTETGAFSLEWYGAVIDDTPPPVDMIPSFYYKMGILFEPDEDRFYYDRLTAYYGNGMTEQAMLYGNMFDIPRETTLELLYPNGGEIFGPCEIVEVKWKGHSLQKAVKVEYSGDGGFTWNDVGYSQDSTYPWRVPDDITEEAMIRISQDYEGADLVHLKEEGDYVPVHAVGFSSVSGQLATLNPGGIIREWDVVDEVVLNRYQIGDYWYAGKQIKGLGIGYVKGDSEIVACYRPLPGGFGAVRDSLAYMKIGEPDPYKVVPIDPDFKTGKMIVDKTKNYLALVPVLGAKVLILDAETGEKINELVFDYPVSSFSFSEEQNICAASLYDGEVVFFSMGDFVEQNRMNLDFVPLAMQTALSPNGKYFAVACRPPTPTVHTGNLGETHVVDVESRMVVRTIRNTASDPVEVAFNPASTILAVGSQAQPQLFFWDLPMSKVIASLPASQGALTDVEISPNGSMIAASSMDRDNLVIQNYSLPESDDSDGMFTIVEPQPIIKSIAIEPQYLGTRNEFTAEAVICNEDPIPYLLSNFQYTDGRFFRLLDSPVPDTISPGECKNVKFAFEPLDTGLMKETVIFRSCADEFPVEIEARSLPRNISFPLGKIIFDETCAGTKTERTIILLKNEDPAPLIINGIASDGESSPFYLSPNISDTTLAPGETLEATVVFAPTETGLFERNIVIKHSNQDKMVAKVPISGVGIGTQPQFDRNDLRFIPEIPNRKILVKNNSDNEIELIGAEFDPPGFFSIVDALPVSIPAGDSVYVEIAWNGEPTDDVRSVMRFAPCAANQSIYMGLYSGTSSLSIPTVEADPRDRTAIPIEFVNTRNKDYNGVRTLEGKISVRSRMFFPEAVVSDYGEGFLTSNEVSGDRRIVGFRVEGDFPIQGEACRIEGVAGLSEYDESDILFVEPSLYWGSAVETSVSGGKLKLINLCDDRRLKFDRDLQILSINPHPVTDRFQIVLDSKTGGEIELKIYDYLGVLHKEVLVANAKVGENSIWIDFGEAFPATYKITATGGGATAAASFIKIR